MNNRLQEISMEIGPWADKNFPVHIPELGIVEELGEMSHAILKNRQKIRGLDEAVKFKHDLADALADCVIFGLHYCFLRGVIPPASLATTDNDGGEMGTIKMMVRAASALIHTDDLPLQHTNIRRLFDGLNTVATNYEINLMEKIEETWKEVQQRDWSKNRVSANEDAAVETLAEKIYEKMAAEDPEGVKYPWVPGGNSDKQEEARSKARKELSLFSQHQQPEQ